MRKFNFWIKLCFINFFIVSVVGTMMRYNIAFSLPGFSHKFMQESHSHFAFYGWVSAAIYLFVTRYLDETSMRIMISKYRFLMISNLIGAYGMLLTFLYGGYFWLSIVFASVALFTGFAYFAFLLIDLRSDQRPETVWLKSGAFFAVFSSLGIFGLSYFSARKDDFEILFRASTYFYLHYQYNGFFLFSCVGLFLISLKKYGIQIPEKLNRTVFYLLFSGCFLGYCLSILWLNIYWSLRIFFILISLMQLFGGVRLFIWVRNQKFPSEQKIQKLLLTVFGFVFLAKFVLQSLSVIPALGAVTFSNINVVIAYLHLVLLMGISIFLIWLLLQSENIQMTKTLKVSTLILISAIVCNEVILFLSAIFSVANIAFSTSKYWLLFISVVIVISIAGFIRSLKLR
ncbi:hypothetical protein MKJ01_12280 [Chryseobacterium sp. SSA4.19]|uniref:hypothetical protein n=1 Tax=Chryseobacterium sp. SSA4.19 TaxID=2919915 RepID=UPI001F4EBC1B|nr:hypothetical protein [Chryseobacterium sp. SSA4.19]MCJ8154542.1 hypothetical protein [Chryseobacterium sp. SSA4.19]